MELAKNLVDKRDGMEQELQRLKQFLFQNNVNMTDPLVDADGFPRSDIDVYAIRKTRQQIICLENDLRAIMKEIEEALINLHGEQRVSVQPAGGDDKNAMDWKMIDTNDPNTSHRTSNQIFLRAEEISPGSPAAESGLLSGDQIVQFGSLCASNYSNLQQVAEVVRNSINIPIRVTVVRDTHVERLSLTPKSWSGLGYLGCRVVPVIHS